MNSQISLKEACDFILDGTHGSPERVREGIPVLSAQNVAGGKLNFATDRFTTTSEYQAFSRRLAIRQGDVLLTIVGTIGRAAVVDELKPLVFQRSVAVLRPKNSLLDSRFLFHITQSIGFRDQIRKATNQSSQAGVYLGKLEKVKIPLPPIAEQKRIAAILDKAEELRSLRRQALGELDAISRSIFLEMFGDPATNPKGWEVAKLGDISEQITDGEHQTPKRTLQGIKLLSARNVQDGYIDVKDVDYISTEEYERIKRRCNPVRGDILISCSGTIGRVTMVETDEPFSLVRSVALVKPRSNFVYSKFIECFLRTSALRKKMQQRANASSQANLFQNQIRDLPAFLPPLSLQKEFTRRVEAIKQLKTTHRESLAHLDALFASLQHRAFRGEL